MSSFDGDSEIILEGTYTSPNNEFKFQVAGSEDAYFLDLIRASVQPLQISYLFTKRLEQLK